MKYIIRGKGNGKTTQLLYAAHTMDIPIIVPDYAHKNNLEKRAKDLGLDGLRIQAFTERTMAGEFKPDDTILIDDAEQIIERALSSFFRCKIGAVTLTDEKMD